MMVEHRRAWSRAIVLAALVCGLAGCTSRPTATPAPTPDIGPGSGPHAPLSEVEDAATADALREIARATADALGGAPAEPAPTNALSAPSETATAP